MAADGGIALMENGTGVEAGLGDPEQGLDLKQVMVADDSQFCREFSACVVGAAFDRIAGGWWVFKGRHCKGTVILLCVRWDLAYELNLSKCVRARRNSGPRSMPAFARHLAIAVIVAGER